LRESWTWNISNRRVKRAEAREEARRAAAKYDKMASYIAAAMKILAEDSEDDTDHEDTPTPPTFTVQLFLDSLFFGLLTFFNGEMNQKQRKI